MKSVIHPVGPWSFEVFNETGWRTSDLLRMIDLCFHGFAFKDKYGYEHEQSDVSVEMVRFRSAGPREHYMWTVSTYRETFRTLEAGILTTHKRIRQALLHLPANRLNPLPMETALRNMLVKPDISDRANTVTDDLRMRAAQLRRFNETFGSLENAIKFRRKEKRKHQQKKERGML